MDNLELSTKNNFVENKYVSYSQNKRQGIALCLSGGGFRAAIFHLGALRRLNELGILSQVNTITSVSGGSIISAYLAEKLQPWPTSGSVLGDWDTKIALPFKDFVRKDICTIPFLKGLLPWNWFRPRVQVEALTNCYFDRLTKLNMSELPQNPNFIFCATDLVFGVNWEMSRDKIGDYQAGYISPTPSDFKVATAIAASSCFPPLFRPMPIPVDSDKLTGGGYTSSNRNMLVSKLRLTDGGVYDNMGFEPVCKSHKVVLVSDGGAPFEFKESITPIKQIQRYLEVVGKQSVSLRKRWLMLSYTKKIMEGTYWGISSSPYSYSLKFIGYPKDIAREYISRIRTDMNSFNDAEIAILENHGYLLAEAAIKEYMLHLIRISAPLLIPHSQWMDKDKVKSALKESHKRVTLKRFLDLIRP